ncbi:P-loop NTPase family protein [Nodularia spumigena]|nr:hypothetical protein [Nodularia spumigena]
MPVDGANIIPLYQDGKNILQQASAGLALHGMLISTNEEDILQQRFNLITVQGNISLTHPSYKATDNTEEFKSETKESIFKRGVEKFGASIKASAKGNGLFGGLLNASASFSSQKETENINETKQTTTSNYYSKVQYVVMPVAACTITSNQIRLDNNALQELKRIDNILRNPESEYITIQACKDFLKDYGSHALLGTVTFGSISLIVASSSGFSSTEEQNIQNIVNSKLTTQFQIGFIGIGEGSIGTDHSSRNENQYIYKQEITESKIKIEKLQIGGLQSDQAAIIDRDYRRAIAVWEIICRYHLHEFENPQKLIELLRQEWMNCTGLKDKFQYFVDEISKINEQTQNLLNQQIPSWIQERQLNAENLNHLIRLRRDFKTKTDNNNYWVQEILSSKIVQQYLLDIRYNNNADSKEIKELMRQIVNAEDTTVMSKEDYSQFKNIFKWLNERSEVTDFIIASEINNINELINKISDLIIIIILENDSTKESRKKQAYQYIILAINSLRTALAKKDKLSELSLLCLLFPLGYVPEFSFFNKVWEFEDYQTLEKLLREDQEHPFGIEAKNYQTEKQEAYLILKMLSYDICFLEKERTIDFIQQILLPNLQSESIISILKRYNVGLSYECVEAVKELQNVIDDQPQNKNSGIGLQDIMKETDNNSPKKSPVTSSDEQPSPESQDILERLGLTKYYPGKLRREEIYSITEYSLEQNLPATTEQLATHFLSNLISFNYEGRKLKIASENKSATESEQSGSRFGRRRKQEAETANVYPLDVVAATFLCCNSIIQQDLVQRLWGCKLAIPLVIQEGEDKSPKFFLWAMRSLVMKWKALQGTVIKSEERGIANYPIETVSFIRFDKSDFSKSSLLNWVISENEPDKSHPVFFHRNSEGSTKNRQLADGTVEIGWYLPKGVKEDIFQDIVSFTNLRGDARNYPVQLELIKQFSAKVVILVSAKELKEKETEIVQSFLSVGKNVIILLTDKTITEDDDETVNNFIEHFSSYDEQLVIVDIENKNSPDIRDEIRRILTEIKGNDNSKISLENLAQTMQQEGMDVDELEANCQQGIKKAQQILQIIQKYDRDKRKAEILPLQGKDWANWAEADKEIYRLVNVGEETASTYVEKQEERKIASRKRQFSIVKNGLPEVMKLFIETFLNEHSSTLEYFVRWLKLGLDELSREELPRLYSSYGEQMKKIHDATPEEKAAINNILNELDQKISSQSFGLEHLLREMGQIYSAVMERPESERAEFKDLERLPQIAADLLLSGYPVEIMDGDVGSVPFVWVETVLKELNKTLKKREGKENLQVFVLSAMGIQSSGKSTLLNTMFGLQFAVSAGRCTKGVYLQPVKLEQKLREKYNVDYIFVVDTEGLKSPELSSDSTRKHDNELSTFVIGLSNLALIKLPGENNTYLSEMLPISVHAFLRMQEVNLRPKTKIVHRNVSITDQEKLNTQNRVLNENLDKYTRIACEIEEKPVQTFKDVIDFNLTEDVEYLSSLHEGDDDRNAVIPNYSKQVNGLKRRIIQGLNSRNQLSISDFSQHLDSLWYAVKKDDFVYEFKNITETLARGELDKSWSQIETEFRTPVTDFTMNSYTKIMNCANEAELSQVFEKLKPELSDKIQEIFSKQEESLKQFFTKSKGMYEGSMQQWEASTFARLEDLKDSLRRQNNEKIQNSHDNRLAEIKIRIAGEGYEEKITEMIRKFVQEEKKRQHEQGEMLIFSEEELRELFDPQWEVWIADLRREYDKNRLKPANVEKHNQEALIAVYPDRWSSITKEIQKRSEKIRKDKKLNNFDDGNFSIHNNHYEKTTLLDQATGWLFKTKENEVIKEIEEIKNKLFEDVSKLLREKENNSRPYNDTVIGNIIRKIKSTIEKKSEKLFDDFAFRLTPELKIDLTIIICSYAIERLKNIDQKYRDNHDPIKNLDKEYYFGIFKVSFNKQNLVSTMVSVLCEIIRQGIAEKIEVILHSEIGNKMLSKNFKIFTDKQSLIANILVSLAQKGDINSYYTYIKKPEQSFKSWISSYFDEFNTTNKGIEYLIEDKIKILLDAAKDFVKSTNQYIESQDKNSRFITNWTKKFRELTREHLILKNIERIEILSDSFEGDFNFKSFQDEINKELNATKSKLANKLSYFSNPQTKKYADLRSDVVNDIINLRIGCLKSCPFCGEICIAGGMDEDHNHETPYHRPQGITGYRPVYGKPKLAIETCQQDVAGEGSFINPDTNGEYRLYKDYRKVNDYYASWKINGDLSLEAGSYWKWFMTAYSSELAKLYDADEPDIPESWKSLSKEKEIEKLRKIIEG